MLIIAAPIDGVCAQEQRDGDPTIVTGWLVRSCARPENGDNGLSTTQLTVCAGELRAERVLVKDRICEMSVSGDKGPRQVMNALLEDNTRAEKIKDAGEPVRKVSNFAGKAQGM